MFIVYEGPDGDVLITTRKREKQMREEIKSNGRDLEEYNRTVFSDNYVSIQPRLNTVIS